MSQVIACNNVLRINLVSYPLNIPVRYCMPLQETILQNHPGLWSALSLKGSTWMQLLNFLILSTNEQHHHTKYHDSLSLVIKQDMWNSLLAEKNTFDWTLLFTWHKITVSQSHATSWLNNFTCILCSYHYPRVYHFVSFLK